MNVYVFRPVVRVPRGGFTFTQYEEVDIEFAVVAPDMDRAQALAWDIVQGFDVPDHLAFNKNNLADLDLCADLGDARSLIDDLQRQLDRIDNNQPEVTNGDR